jgi:tetratricopeptide (TPR) repeat protein
VMDAEYSNHRARFLYLKAALSYWRDNFEDALAAGLDAEKLARELNDQKLLANVLYYLGGSIYREMGEFDKAEQSLQESIALCRENKLQSRLSIALTSFGIVLFNRDKKEESRNVVEEALQISRRENDLWGQGYALRVQADNLRFEGKFAESLEIYQRAFDIAQAIDDRISMGIELANMSLLTNVLEDDHASGNYAESALSIFRRIGNEYQQPFPLRMMAYAALHTANPEQARMLCIESLRGNQKIGHQSGMLACLLALAEIELVSNNISKATRLFVFVKAQLDKHFLRLMEPDQAAMHRLEAKLFDANIQKVQQELSGLSMEEMIRELKIIID